MSWNLHLHARVENGDDGYWILTRALTGITHSAIVSAGDIIDFDGVEVVVDKIRHKHVKPTSDIGAVSEAMCYPVNVPLSLDAMQKLIEHGFKRLT